jgi:hypothetical protein
MKSLKLRKELDTFLVSAKHSNNKRHNTLETILAFALGVATSYWFLALVIGLALWTEYEDKHVGSAFFTILGLASGYFIFNLSPLLLLGYIPAGVAWSVWRWRVHCKKCVILAKEGKLFSNSWHEHDKDPVKQKEDQRRYLEHDTDLKNNVDKIISWIICFPVSILERAAHDLIHVLKIFVTEWFAKVYNHSSKSALDEFDKS